MKCRSLLSSLLLLLSACSGDRDRTPATAIVSGAQADCTHSRTAFRCVKYIRNYDGDTLTMEIPGVHPLLGEKIGVRVRGIDTPEIKGKRPCEKDSARNARKLVEAELKNAKRIDLVDIGRDKYFRIDADVIVDGRNLGELLIKNNLAYRYDGGTKQIIDWCGRTRP
jgi:micrococcal nuclease